VQHRSPAASAARLRILPARTEQLCQPPCLLLRFLVVGPLRPGPQIPGRPPPAGTETNRFGQRTPPLPLDSLRRAFDLAHAIALQLINGVVIGPCANRFLPGLRGLLSSDPLPRSAYPGPSCSGLSRPRLRQTSLFPCSTVCVNLSEPVLPANAARASSRSRLRYAAADARSMTFEVETKIWSLARAAAGRRLHGLCETDASSLLNWATTLPLCR
jgi:hypothetical protein